MPPKGELNYLKSPTAVPSSNDLWAMSAEELARYTGQDGAFDIRHRSLRQGATTTSALLKTVFTALAEEVAAHLGRPLKPKLAQNVELLGLNLYAVYRQDDRLCVELPMDIGWYSAEQPRNPILSYRITVEQAFRGLRALGYVELVRKGSPWAGFHSLVRATPALIGYLDSRAPNVPASALRMVAAADPIILMGPRPAGGGASKGSVDADQDDTEVSLIFPDTPETQRMRAAITRINAVNTPDRIRLPDLGEDWVLLHDALWKPSANGKPSWSPGNLDVWFADTALRRIFNRGSFDLGGRFYGAAWQSLPKAWRKRILIDGEGVVELDYGSLHPRLLLHLYEGVEAPEDPYALVDADRDLVKRAMMALLNMENGTNRPPKWFEVEDAGMRWRELCVRITAGLPGIIPYIGTGIGLKLQRVDSDLAEAVMLHFAERGIPCLGIHDSFIVPERHQAELQAVMKHVYRSRTGFEAVVKPG